MTWSVIKQQVGYRVVRLDLVGDLSGSAASSVQLMLVQTVDTDLPDELLVGLHAVSVLDVATVSALLAGYIAAIEHGTSYRVVGAHGRARHILQRTGMSEVLADSDDLGALMLALLLRPVSTELW